jgi:MHS family alpha-ketoglutarate permease-like MFS transporter
MSATTHGERIGAIAAGSAGNLIEWYDFYTYAFTALYFAPSFFPSGNRTAQLLDVAGIYAVGFLIRPLGAWYFGRYGDRKGRKAAMVYSVLLMGTGSLLVAVMPTYRAIGGAAPVLLLLARLLQGFSTGGQYGPAAAYLSETPSEKRRGFFASFQYVTLIGGQLGALLVLMLLQHLLSGDTLRAWAWRIPFLIGAVLAFSILSFSHAMVEPAVAPRAGAERGGLRALAQHRRSLLIVMAISGAGALVLYTFTTYMQKFLVNTAGMDIKIVSGVMIAAMLVFMLLQPALGALSDRIGRRRNLMLFGGLMTLLAMPLLMSLSRVSDGYTAFMLVAASLFILSFYSSVSGLFKSELFPAHVRALGVGVAHNIATAIFGGTAEFAALFARQHGHETWFYAYVAAICLLAFCSAFFIGDARIEPT